MNTSIEKLIFLARKEKGVREGPINNTGQRIEEFQSATWMMPGAWPWCAAFTAWLMREWLHEESVRDALGIDSVNAAEKWRCRDASAFGWEKWAAQKNIELLPETEAARAGDFVVYDFSHIGLVIKDQPSQAGAITTIEGNTNGKGERDSNSGDGVWEKTRARSLTKSYIRLFA